MFTPAYSMKERKDRKRIMSVMRLDENDELFLQELICERKKLGTKKVGQIKQSLKVNMGDVRRVSCMEPQTTRASSKVQQICHD